MVSIILAIALPLALGLCIVVLLGFVYHYRRQQALTSTERSALQARLDSFPENWMPHEFTHGFSTDDVKDAYIGLHIAMDQYVGNWIIFNMSSQPFNDSVSRIEDVLFPSLGEKHRLNANKDISIFRNPHNYTAAEIKTCLERDDRNGRQDIVSHIMMSVLLPAVSLDGDPLKTLLPFSPGTVFGLDNLYTATRRIDVSHDVRLYISQFSLYFSRPKGDDGRERYRRLFNTLFEPYFSSRPRFESTSRHNDLDKVLDAAVKYGMVVLGHTDIIEHRWGSRVEGKIMTRPAAYSLNYDMDQDAYKLVDSDLDEARANHEAVAGGWTGSFH